MKKMNFLTNHERGCEASKNQCLRSGSQRAKSRITCFRLSSALTPLLMCLFLTLGVGQMWAAWYCPGTLTSWSQGSSEQMTQLGSTNNYYIVVSNKASGNYQFRVTEGSWDKDHGWSQASASSSDFTLTTAGSDNNININLTATSTLTVWFNSDANKIWVTSGNYNVTQTIYVIGSNSWTDANVKAHVFTDGAAYKAWASDDKMTKSSTISRAGITYKVYSYSCYKAFKSVIFRYGTGEGDKTDDLEWSASNPYYSTELSAWFASTADALAKYLAGENWTGASWSTTASKMTDNGDGSYSKDISISDASNTISLKVCKYNTWTDAFGGDAAGTGHNLSVDFGKDGDGNLTFKVAHAGTTKITLTSTGVINVDAPYQVSYAAGTGATGTVSASSVTTYGSTCSLSSSTFTKTYYTQDGWATSNGGDKAYNLGATYTGGYEDVTLYPHWTKTTYSITLDDDGDYDGDGSATVQYGDASLTVSSHASREDWNLVGYWNSSGDQVSDAEGVLLTSVDGYTDASGHWIYDGNVTLYAHWSQTYSLTVAAGSNISSVSGSNADVTLNSKYAISATPNTGYSFSGWTASPSDNGVFDDASAASTNVTVKNGSVTVTGAATENLRTVSIVASPAGAGTFTVNSVSGTSASVGVTTSKTIVATPINDFNFTSWSATNCTASPTNNRTTTLNGDGSTGSGTLTATFTPITCKVYKMSTAVDGSSTDLGTMSYDISEAAYYLDVTTNAKPYYFRFHYTNGDEYSATWNGDYPNITEVVVNGSKVTCNQKVVDGVTPANSWEHKPAMYFDGLSSSPIRIWFDFQNKKAWITETTYSVTVNDGAHGEVDPHGSVFVGKNDGKELEATPDAGWMFDNWSKTGSAVLSSTSTNPTTLTATNTGTVTANYKHRYILRGSIDADGDPAGGMAGWSATSNSSYSSVSIVGNVMTITANLTAAKTKYKFKYFDYTTADTYHGQTGTGEISSGTEWTLNGSNDIYFTTTAPGTYTFAFNVSTKAFTVTAPTTYTVTYGYGTGGSGVTATVSGNSIGSSPGYAQSGSDVVLSYTKLDGYDFKEWNTASNGSGTKLGTGDTYTISSISADKTVYAIFTPHTYTGLTLDKTIGDTDGAYSVTYKNTSLSVTTTPTKTGYNVEGYYKTYSAGVWSDKVATSAGTLQPNITDITNGSSQWISTSSPTLYTKWQAKTYTAANNIDGNSGSNGKYTATYDATSIAINTAPTRSGYTLTGFHAYGRGANTLANSSGTLVASQSENGNGDRELTNASNHWIYDNTDAVIYADWSANPYTITFNADDASRVGTATNMQATVTVHFDNDDYKVSSTSVTTVAIPVLSGYTFGGYYTAVNGGGEQIVNASGAWQSSKTNYTDGSGNWIKAANTTLYAKWTEDMHTVTVTTDGHGTITTPDSGTPRTVSAGIATGKTIAASANTGYVFNEWTVESGSATFANASASSTTVKATSTATVQANFVDEWNLKGSEWGSWGTYQPLTATGEDDEYSITLTLTKDTPYSFKVVKRNYGSSDNWYGNTNNAGNKVFTRGMSAFTTVAEGTNNNLAVTPDVSGDYTFTIDVSGETPVLTVTFQSAYTVTYGADSHGEITDASGSTDGSFDSGDYVKAGDNITFTQSANTGYKLKGWYTTVDGSTAVSTMAVNDNVLNGLAATATVYAQYQPKTCTVNLNFDESDDGFGSKTSATTSVTGTYDAAMPTIAAANLPKAKAGYAFMGFFTETNGGGTQYYNADGTSAKVWDQNTESTQTLYADWEKADITSLEYNANIAKGDPAYLVVNPVLNVTPEDYTDICWTLHYQETDAKVDDDKWSVASYTESDTKPYQVRFTVTDMADGQYYVKAVLKAKETAFTDICDDDEEDVEELDTETGNFRIAGNSTIVIRYQDAGGLTLHADNSVEVAANATIGIKAPAIIGYDFSEWELSDVMSNECASSANCGADKDSINVSATYNTFLTARYTKKNLIYFNNANVGWDQVYVYFYDDETYWDHESGKGIGGMSDYEISSHAPHHYHVWGAMTRIPGTDVWYYDYEAAAALTSMSEDEASGAVQIEDYTVVAFTQDAQGWTADTEGNRGYKHFWSTKAAYRDDFDHDQSMYVPIDANTETKNENCVYYNTGYWMNYPDSTGYVLKIYDNTTSGALKKTLYFPFSANKAMPVSITTDLEGKKTYGFKIEDPNGTAYGNTGTMSNGHSGDEGQNAPWEFKSGVSNKCGLTTSSAGDYTFTLTYGLDIAATPGYNFLVGVHYPEATGDYRVLYKDNAHSNWEISKVIPRNLSKDTISYFVRYAQSPVMKLQKCSATWNGETTTVTWTDTVDNLISSLPAAITEDGVYYFCLNKKEDGSRELGDTKPYEGNFYIRTDGAGYSGWDNFRANDHLMPYSDYSYHQSTEPYSHYFTKWYDVSGGKNKNVKFVVANDYSVHISDTVVQDGLTDKYVDANGWLIGRSANIRFMYNYKTNAVTRRYVDGAQGAGSDDFLKIIVETANTIYVRNKANDADSAVMEVKFTDKGNWIYEAKVKAKPGATYRLKSSFGTAEPGVVEQYFKGTSSTYEKLVGGSGSTALEFRLLYDFKTNRLVTAYIPSGTLDADLNIEADIMFVREHQGDIEEVKFTGGAKIKDIQTVYSVLKFNKYTLNNRKKTGDHGYLDDMLSRYERDLFYVSFPYDVKVSDIIGFGTYGQHWIIEYYDGANRAKSGFWIDSDPNWKFVTPAMRDTFELKKGVGYLVALDLDELWWAKDDEYWHDAIWDNVEVEELELLFPGKVDSISSTSVTYTVPAHTCTIERDSRNIKDSHWNIMGVPTYSNPEGDGVFSNNEWIAKVPKFIYAWNMTDNTVTPTVAEGYKFKAMHAYMVQYCGDVTFTAIGNTPASVAARRNEDAPSEVELRLEIQQNDQMIDQTFVNLSNSESASAGFEYGEDLTKEFNANKANIYTFIADVEAAGNTLPISDQTTVVPVGVKIVADGDYTFAMPAGTNGIGVTLIDNGTGIRTPLSALDYTINLAAGTYDDRFLLEISPIQQTPTDVELLNGANGENGVRKVMIDGLLYIVKDGKVYDAQGKRVQ